jgi:galactonate dehydratase
MLLSLGLAPLAAAAPKVALTGLEIFNIAVNRRGNWIIPRIRTSAGVTGIGDASHGGPDELKLRLIPQFFELFKKRGVFEIEALRQEAAPVIARNGTAGAIAFSSLEQCAWDIAGKVLGLPTYALFGGKLRDSILHYANVNRALEDRSAAAFAGMAARAIEAGFDTVKISPFDERQTVEPGLERAWAVRKAIGESHGLMIDCHSRFELKRGLALIGPLEPLKLAWLEEVTPVPDLPQIRQAEKMPTAGGEETFGVKGFYEYIRAGSVDIIMPDVKYGGGMMELKKIAAMAEGAGIPVAPHGPASPVGNMTAAQVCAGLPNFKILEYAFGEAPWRAELIDPPEQFTRGYLPVSDRPGHGITLNEKVAAKHKT